jgi:hypothetical protein
MRLLVMFVMLCATTVAQKPVGYEIEAHCAQLTSGKPITKKCVQWLSEMAKTNPPEYASDYISALKGQASGLPDSAEHGDKEFAVRLLAALELVKMDRDEDLGFIRNLKANLLMLGDNKLAKNAMLKLVKQELLNYKQVVRK